MVLGTVWGRPTRVVTGQSVRRKRVDGEDGLRPVGAAVAAPTRSADRRERDNILTVGELRESDGVLVRKSGRLE